MKKVEISLREIFVYVLRRWKPILVFAIVMAIALGFNGFMQQKSIEAKNNIQKNRSLIDTANENDLAGQQTTLNLSIDLDLSNFEKYREYHDNIAKNDILSKIQDRYLIIAQSASLKTILKDIIPSEFNESALQEIVKVESSSTGVISISVMEYAGIQTKEIAEAIYNYLLGYKDLLSQSVSKHTLSILAMGRGISMPDPTTEQPLKEKTPLGAGFSSAIIGLLIGIVIAILVASIVYLIKLPIQTPEQIQRQLNVRYLGGIRKNKRLSWGDRLSGSLRIADEEKAMEIIAANLRDFAGLHKKTLVTGTVSESLIKVFAEKITTKFKNEEVIFSYGADINKDPDTIKKLAESDAVILIERLNGSKLRHVNEEKERIDMSDKKIIGYVLFSDA